MNLALLGNSYDEIFETAKQFTAAVEERLPGFTRPRISYDPTQPQLSVEIDRRRAADLGVDLNELAATLRAMIDGDELIDLNIDDEAIPIRLESGSGDINDPSDLVNLYVSANDGQLVPLSSIVRLEEAGVVTELNRNGQRRSIEVSINLQDDYPLQDAVDDLRALSAEILPPSMSLMFRGEAATLEETNNDVLLTYAMALIIIFLVLAAQFEGFMSAVVVTLLVPFGIADAVFALNLTGTRKMIISAIA